MKDLTRGRKLKIPTWLKMGDTVSFEARGGVNVGGQGFYIPIHQGNPNTTIEVGVSTTTWGEHGVSVAWRPFNGPTQAPRTE